MFQNSFLISWTILTTDVFMNNLENDLNVRTEEQANVYDWENFPVLIYMFDNKLELPTTHISSDCAITKKMYKKHFSFTIPFLLGLGSTHFTTWNVFWHVTFTSYFCSSFKFHNSEKIISMIDSIHSLIVFLPKHMVSFRCMLSEDWKNCRTKSFTTYSNISIYMNYTKYFPNWILVLIDY